jgi:hypothetical protein
MGLNWTTLEMFGNPKSHQTPNHSNIRTVQFDYFFKNCRNDGRSYQMLCTVFLATIPSHFPGSRLHMHIPDAFLYIKYNNQLAETMQSYARQQLGN